MVSSPQVDEHSAALWARRFRGLTAADSPTRRVYGWTTAMGGMLMLAQAGNSGFVCFVFPAVIMFVLGLVYCTRRKSEPCERCGEVNRAEAAYCAHCGRKLDEE